MHIAGGSVTYGRTVKPADYESKKVEVTLSFGLDEGEDADVMAALVIEKARRLAEDVIAGRKPATPVTKTALENINAQKATAAASLNAADKAATKVKPPKASGTKPAEKPAEPVTPPAEPAKDEWDTETAAEPAKTITDTDLHQACSRKVADLKKVHEGAAPGMIRKLIGEYFKDEERVGKQLKDIPQEERQDFLDELEKLK